MHCSQRKVLVYRRLTANPADANGSFTLQTECVQTESVRTVMHKSATFRGGISCLQIELLACLLKASINKSKHSLNVTHCISGSELKLWLLFEEYHIQWLELSPDQLIAHGQTPHWRSTRRFLWTVFTENLSLRSLNWEAWIERIRNMIASKSKHSLPKSLGALKL